MKILSNKVLATEHIEAEDYTYLADDGRYITYEYNTVRYYNAKHQLHRYDGPAIEYSDGDRSWYINGIGTGFTSDHGKVSHLPDGSIMGRKK